MQKLQKHEGFTLLETVFALSMLLIVAAGIMPLGLLAVRTTENQGHLAARTTEYAQDKLEQLMALSWGDSATDTTQPLPVPETGGTGLAIGGSSDPDAAVAKYVDYLDIDGNLVGAGGDGGDPADWYYKRAWQVSSPRANLKKIEVSATVRVASQGGVGDLPKSTVTALKTNPF